MRWRSLTSLPHTSLSLSGYFVVVVVVHNITDVIIYPPFSHLPPTLTLSCLHHTVVCGYELCVYVLYLICSVPSSGPPTLPSDSCPSVPCIPASVSILFFHHGYFKRCPRKSKTEFMAGILYLSSYLNVQFLAMSWVVYYKIPRQENKVTFRTVVFLITSDFMMSRN